jgi:hypothetical protein
MTNDTTAATDWMPVKTVTYKPFFNSFGVSIFSRPKVDPKNCTLIEKDKAKDEGTWPS